MAEALSPAWVSPVALVTCVPPIVTTPVALIVKTPAVVLLIVMVQVAVLPLTVGAAQVLLVEVGAGEMFGVIELNATGVALPGMAVKVTVNVWATPTLFVEDAGVMVMLASTNVLVALGLSPACVSPVVRVRVALLGEVPIVTVPLALMVKVPTVALLIVIVQVSTFALTAVGELQVFVLEVGLPETLGVIVPNETGAPLGMAVNVTVNVCGFPISLVAL